MKITVLGACGTTLTPLWPGTDQAAADGFDGRTGVAAIGQVIDLDH